MCSGVGKKDANHKAWLWNSRPNLQTPVLVANLCWQWRKLKGFAAEEWLSCGLMWFLASSITFQSILWKQVHERSSEVYLFHLLTLHVYVCICSLWENILMCAYSKCAVSISKRPQGIRFVDHKRKNRHSICCYIMLYLVFFISLNLRVWIRHNALLVLPMGLLHCRQEIMLYMLVMSV